jgi:hypothetical protein
MRKWIAGVIGLLVLAGGMTLAWPKLWEMYERATAPLPPPFPDDGFHPENPAAVATTELLAKCHRGNNPFDALAINTLCVADFGERRRDRAIVTPRLMEFMRSANGVEAAEGIALLGWFDHRAAAPEITRHLSSNDWRVVLAASQTLGWLGAVEALPELDGIARTHWLPEVRQVAERSAAAIRTTGRLDPPKVLRGDGDQDYFWKYMRFEWVRDPALCPSRMYIWNRQLIDWEDRRSELSFAMGRLKGYDRGEWGGALTWRPWFGRATVLNGDNVQGLARDGGDAVVLFGLAHMNPYGYAAGVTRDGHGGWRVEPPIALPGAVSDLTTVAPGVFAALTEAGAVVFTRKNVLGIADCAPGPASR